MEARFFRLVIFLSLAAIIGFGSLGWGLHSAATSHHDLVLKITAENRSRLLNCEGAPQPCDSAPAFLDLLNSSVRDRNDKATQAENYFKLAMGIPLVLLVLFFGGRWVITGRLRVSNS